jgi:hypothetical protein
MPLPGEDATGIWHRRYYAPGTIMAERLASPPASGDG